MLPIGVALSGGTARSVAHVGVLKALTEAGMPIDHIAATSGGSMVATFFASGMPMSSMLHIANSLSWAKLVTIRFSRLGFISSKRIEDFVRDYIGDMKFKDLKTPCYVVATDLETGRKHIFKSGSVARAVRASCSIPQIFLPVEVDGHYYVDGGFSEYLPVETLQDTGPIFVIASNLAQERAIYRRPRNYLQLAIHIMGLVAKTNAVVSQEKADILIRPPMEGVSPFDFERSDDLISLGYETTRALIPEIERRWKQKSSKLQRLIDKISPKP